MTCRHGFHPGRCLAPACENAPAPGAKPRPALRRGVREVAGTRLEVRDVPDVRRGVRDDVDTAAGTKLEHLSRDEAAAARRLIGNLQGAEAARALGLHSPVTMYRALALQPIHPLTAAVVRARLKAGRS
ncbi:MAG: hypothetical protein HS104_12605 [Polyangiaceae bacterium]|nr:hypothetical protein [Polyangiaceae bacterium]